MNHSGGDDIAEETRSVPAVVRNLFQVIIILGILFSAGIFIIPLNEYQFIGNFFEAFTGLICMICCLFAYRHISKKVILLLAAFAFGGYTLLTIFWYSFTFLLGRGAVFTTVSELGFFGFLLFFIAIFKIGFPETPVSSRFSAGIILLFLIIPLSILIESGLSLNFILLLLRFLVIGILIDTAVRHRIFDNLLLGTGICLWCLADILYGFRETFYLDSLEVFPIQAIGHPLRTYDFLSIVGPMIIIAFALIQLGLLSYAEKEKPSLQL